MFQVRQCPLLSFFSLQKLEKLSACHSYQVFPVFPHCFILPVTRKLSEYEGQAWSQTEEHGNHTPGPHPFSSGKVVLTRICQEVESIPKTPHFPANSFPRDQEEKKKKKKQLKCEKKKEKEKTLAKKLYSFHKQKLSFGFHSLTFIFCLCYLRTSK